MKEKIATLSKMSKAFPTGEGEFLALKDIDLDFYQGEFTGIVGPSGSGKTTLLNIIGSLDVPSKGKATVLGQETSQLSTRQSADLRSRRIGFIFQTYNLLPV